LVQQGCLQIRDDDGQIVTMSLEQFDDLVVTLQETIRFNTKLQG